MGLAQKLLVEALGTGLLCFTVGCAAARTDYAALAIGSTLMCAIYAGGHISGANYNPAVSLCLVVRGALSVVDFVLYVLFQLAGAVGGGILAKLVLAAAGGKFGYPAAASTSSLTPALTAEIVLTFALCHTVLHVATVAPAKDRSYYGLAIGFVVVSGAISVGSVSGGAFNPAVGVLNVLANYDLGTMPTMNLLDKQAALLYTAGPLGGAMLAGLLFRVTHPMEFGTVNNPGYSAMVIEFIGTFLLCFTVATAVAGGSDLAPISIGSILMTQVYAGAATSGANYNPAVTFALFAFSILKGSNDMPLSKAFGYVVAQLAGSATAFYTAGLITPTPGFPSSAVPLLWTVGLEAIGTFFLVFTILQVRRLFDDFGELGRMSRPMSRPMSRSMLPMLIALPIAISLSLGRSPPPRTAATTSSASQSGLWSSRWPSRSEDSPAAPSTRPLVSSRSLPPPRFRPSSPL